MHLSRDSHHNKAADSRAPALTCKIPLTAQAASVADEEAEGVDSRVKVAVDHVMSNQARLNLSNHKANNFKASHGKVVSNSVRSSPQLHLRRRHDPIPINIDQGRFGYVGLYLAAFEAQTLTLAGRRAMPGRLGGHPFPSSFFA
jgi:hypothetical protein